MPHRAVHERQACREQKHQEDQIHAGKPGQDPDGGDRLGEVPDRRHPAVGEPQSQRRCEGSPQRNGEHVRPEHASAMLRSEPSLGGIAPRGRWRLTRGRTHTLAWGGEEL